MRSPWTLSAEVAFAALCLFGCTNGDESEDGDPNATDASAPYTPASGAPEFCGEFTDATALLDVPFAVVALAADPADETAQAQVARAADKARAVADAASADAQYAVVTQTATDLANLLDGAVGHPLTGDELASISASLDALGGAVQPICELPT